MNENGLIYDQDDRLRSAIMLLRDFSHRCGGALLRLPEPEDCRSAVCREKNYLNCQIRIGRQSGIYACSIVQIEENEINCPFNGEGISTETASESWPTWIWHRCGGVRAIPMWAVPIIKKRIAERRARKQNAQNHNPV
jgi:hypothetical protein